MKFIDITRKYGSETKAYPFAPFKLEDNYRGLPKYAFKYCIGCSACGVACPPNAISIFKDEAIDKLIWEFDAGRCIFCGRCDEVCPTGAIALSNEFELASFGDKGALIQRGELELEHCSLCQKAFSTKRLVAYTKDKMKASNLSEERLNQAEVYLQICTSCKQNEAIKSVMKKEKIS